MGTATVLNLVPPSDVADDEPHVVAEILADGTVRALDPAVRSRTTESKPAWASGTLSDGSCILWWERRGGAEGAGEAHRLS